MHRRAEIAEQCAEAMVELPLRIVVQPSPVRCFKNEEYTAHGIHLQEDMGDCDVLLGIKEPPVEFLDRVQGQTKLGLRDIWEFFLDIWWIRFQTSYVFIKFAVVGLSGVFVNLRSFILLMHFGLNKFIASPIAIELSIISNFLFNNYWTFGQRHTAERVMTKGLKFNFVSLLTLLISYATFIVTNFLFPLLPPYIHQFIAIAPAGLLNYFCNSYWTFKEKNH